MISVIYWELFKFETNLCQCLGLRRGGLDMMDKTLAVRQALFACGTKNGFQMNSHLPTNQNLKAKCGNRPEAGVLI